MRSSKESGHAIVICEMFKCGTKHSFTKEGFILSKTHLSELTDLKEFNLMVLIKVGRCVMF